jgi:signal transduction histidine kinase
MQFYFPTSLNLGQEHSEGFHQELLRGLTHKLNNLLAVIQGFSSLILMRRTSIQA